MFKYSVITLSDRASENIYEDLSGSYINKELSEDFELDSYHLIKDEEFQLSMLLKELSNSSDFIITTGGTGLCSRDVTVNVVESIMEYEVRGISTAIHMYSLQKSSGAMFSRALGAVYNNTLIITLPGSVKAVTELISYLKPNLEHGLKHLFDIKVH